MVVKPYLVNPEIIKDIQLEDNKDKLFYPKLSLNLFYPKLSLNLNPKLSLNPNFKLSLDFNFKLSLNLSLLSIEEADYINTLLK
jgi:hypothetical protein